MRYNRMSIYSGFPTRKDETSYNQLLARILQLLQAHLLEVIPAEKLPNSKVVAYARVLTKMQQYEEHKYLPPKFSQLLQPLASLIGLPSKIEHHPSCYESPQDKLKAFSSNSPSNLSAAKDKCMVTFKMKEGESLTETQVKNSRKQSRGDDSVVKKRERKFHGSFYDIQERKIKNMHERYQLRVQEVNERINADQEINRLNYRSQTESPADAYKSLKNSKYDPADKYGIVHMRALKQAQDQLRQLKSSTPKPGHRQHT